MFKKDGNSYKFVTYLVGPMDHVSDSGITWRENILPDLSELGIYAINPVTEECNKTGFDANKAKLKLVGYRRSGNWALYDRTMISIMKADMAAVRSSNFLVAYFPENVRMGGTLCEIFTAFMEGIPIYLVTPTPKSQLNFRTLELVRLSHGDVFPNFSQLVDYLKDNQDEIRFMMRERKKIQKERENMFKLIRRPLKKKFWCKARIAGPVEAVSDETLGWYSTFTADLYDAGIDAVNPLTISAEAVGLPAISDVKRKAVCYRKTGDWIEFDKLAKNIIGVEFSSIKCANIFTVRIPENVFPMGTLYELWYAFMLGLPIYLITPETKSDLNNWTLETIRLSHGEVFTNLSQAVDYFKKNKREILKHISNINIYQRERAKMIFNHFHNFNSAKESK